MHTIVSGNLKRFWERPRTNSIILGCLSLLVIVAILTYMFLHQTPSGLPVATAEVKLGSVASYVTMSGEIDGGGSVTVASSTSGVIDELLVQPGSRVHKGDLLAKLDGFAEATQTYDKMTERYQLMKRLADLAMQKWQVDKTRSAALSTIEQDQAAVEATQAQVNAAELLLKDATDAYNTALQENSPSLSQAKANLDQAAGNVSTNKAALQEALVKLQADKNPQDNQVLMTDEQSYIQQYAEEVQAQLDMTKALQNMNQYETQAPVSGVVVSVTKVQGDTVGPSDVICEIKPDVNENKIVGSVTADDASKLSVGQKATITSETDPDFLVTGTVNFVSPIPESSASQTGNFQYKVLIQAGDLPSQARSGMQVSVKITTDEKTDVPVVPANAVMVNGNQTGVYVRDSSATSKYRFVPVQIGASNDQYVQVKNLAPGTIVTLTRPTS